MNPAEEEFYAIAGNEVTSKTMAPGLMAKAIADTGGDERAAVARYIELRAQQLKMNATLEAAKKVDESTARAYLYTVCPKCSSLGYMRPVFWTLSKGCKCPHCNHRFEWYHFTGEGR